MTLSSIGLFSSMLSFHVLILPESVCPPHPRPTAALLQISNKLRLGVHVGSCYLATAVISHDSASTRLPFFLFSRLLVRQQLFLDSTCLIGHSGLCLFLYNLLLSFVITFRLKRFHLF